MIQLSACGDDGMNDDRRRQMLIFPDIGKYDGKLSSVWKTSILTEYLGGFDAY